MSDRTEQAFRPNPDEIGVDHARCRCGQTAWTTTRNAFPGASIQMQCPACLDVIEVLSDVKP